MQIYANLCKFIAISLFCCLMATDFAWGQIFDMDYPAYQSNYCGFNRYKDFVLPPLVPIGQRIDSSSFVFEGAVVRARDLRYNNRIYQCYTVAVKKIFKGDFVTDTVEVLTYYGRNPDDKRPQYIGEIGKALLIFFVVPTNIIDTSKSTGRLRFKSAVINRSTDYPVDICRQLNLMGDCETGNCEKCGGGISYELTYKALKKYTNKCIIVNEPSKKKLKF